MKAAMSGLIDLSEEKPSPEKASNFALGSLKQRKRRCHDGYRTGRA